MASQSTCVLQPTGDDTYFSQSAVRRFLNNTQLCDSDLSGMDSDTIKQLETDEDLGDYVGEHLKQIQWEEVKKNQNMNIKRHKRKNV